MNASAPLPLNQRMRADLVCLGLGALVFVLSIPAASPASSLRLPGLVVLTAVTVVSGLAGVLAVRFACRTSGDTGWQAARLGARAGLLTALVSAGMIVLAATLAGARGLLSIWLSAPLCILPGALGGMAGASLGVRIAPPPLQDNAADPPPAAGAEAPSWLALPLWALGLFGLISPFYVRPWKDYTSSRLVENPSSRSPTPELLPRPTQALPPTPPSFAFAPSPDLPNTQALRWEISARKPVPVIEGDGPLALSPDGRWLAGIAGHSLAIIDLHNLETTAQCEYGMKVQSICFSPDNRQLFLVSTETPVRVAVMKVEGAHVIDLPQPRQRLIPESPPIWNKNNEILFLSNGEVPLALNLDTLEIGESETSNEWNTRLEAQRRLLTVQGQPSWPESVTWHLTGARFTMATELPEVEGSGSHWPERHGFALAVKDGTGLAGRVFPEIDIETGDRFLASADGTKFIRCRGRAIEAFYFSPLNKAPQLLWEVAMPHDPDSLEDLTVKRTFEAGRLAAFAYPPLINPLNNRVIGPDRRRVLALVRLVKWEGARAWFSNFLETGDTSGPIVIADAHRWNGAEPELIRLATSTRWWSDASVPASPIAISPLPPLENQSAIETRFEGGATRIVAIRDQAPVEAPPAAPTTPPELLPPPAPSPLQPPAPSPEYTNPNPKDGESIGRFVREHYQKARSGDISGAIADFAPRVAYLEAGTVDRSYIESTMREFYSTHREINTTLSKRITIWQYGPDNFVARFGVQTNATVKEDGKKFKSDVPLVLQIEMLNGAPRIVKYLPYLGRQ